MQHYKFSFLNQLFQARLNRLNPDHFSFQLSSLTLQANRLIRPFLTVLLAGEEIFFEALFWV